MIELRLILVASDPLVRAGLAYLLRSEAIRVVAEVSSLEQVHLYEHEANVIVWDNSGETPNEASQLPILALVADDAETLLLPHVQGMLYRSSSPERIQQALQTLAEGLYVYERAFVTWPTHTAQNTPTDLTARELEVLQRLAEGMSNKSIAKTLNISENTVKFHINALLEKFNVGSRTEVVIKAIQSGLVTI
ncbi:MAG: response regulator transcription factor [Trueperaceae bacterium]